MTFSSLNWANEEQTQILAERPDGSSRLIEPTSGDLWSLATSGALGAVGPYVAPPVNMARERWQGLSAVMERVAAIRLKYLTPLPGQDMVYLSKAQEARAWLAAGSPSDLTAYPLIAGEVGVTGADAAEVTGVWLARAAAWTVIAGALEHARLAAAAAIAAAGSVADVDAALADFMADVADL